MSVQRRRYDPDFKRNAVQLLMAMEKCTSFGNPEVYHPCNGISPAGATLSL
jgi:hypothetical protein